MPLKSWWLVSLSIWLGAMTSSSYAEEMVQPVTIHNDMDVGIEYVLTVDGVVVDSTEGKAPFHYIHGRQELVPGLERQLEGMRIGESKEVTVNPADGYGEVDRSAFVEVPKTQLPDGVTPAVGMVLRGVNPDGQSFQATISDVKDQIVVLDLNHRLAGKILNFKVKVVEIIPVAPSATSGALAQ